MLRMECGNIKVLTKVRYIPELNINLINLGTLDALSCSFKTENGSIKIMKDSLMIMKGVRKNLLYV